MSDTTTTADEVTGEVTDNYSASKDTGALVVQDAITRLQSGATNVYSTVQGDDFGAKLKVMSAVTNALAIAEHPGVHIDLENVVIQVVEVTDRNTKETTSQPRVILLDVDGTAYYGISPVLAKAVETFVGVLGQPHTWPEPVGVKVDRTKSNNGFFFYNMTLDPRPKVAAKK